MQFAGESDLLADSIAAESEQLGSSVTKEQLHSTAAAQLGSRAQADRRQDNTAGGASQNFAEELGSILADEQSVGIVAAAAGTKHAGERLVEAVLVEAERVDIAAKLVGEQLAAVVAQNNYLKMQHVEAVLVEAVLAGERLVEAVLVEGERIGIAAKLVEMRLAWEQLAAVVAQNNYSKVQLSASVLVEAKLAGEQRDALVAAVLEFHANKIESILKQCQKSAKPCLQW